MFACALAALERSRAGRGRRRTRVDQPAFRRRRLLLLPPPAFPPPCVRPGYHFRNIPRQLAQHTYAQSYTRNQLPPVAKLSTLCPRPVLCWWFRLLARPLAPCPLRERQSRATSHHPLPTHAPAICSAAPARRVSSFHASRRRFGVVSLRSCVSRQPLSRLRVGRTLTPARRNCLEHPQAPPARRRPRARAWSCARRSVAPPPAPTDRLLRAPWSSRCARRRPRPPPLSARLPRPLPPTASSACRTT